MSKLDNDFLVFTNHDKDAKFESFTTFYIPDSVLVIGTSEKPQFWTANEADDIITTLVNNMESRGFKRTLDKDNADLGLQVSYVQSTQYFADYNDGYNYPYWDPARFDRSIDQMMAALTGAGATTSHTYVAAGEYTVTLTVTDDDGATGTTSGTGPHWARHPVTAAPMANPKVSVSEGRRAPAVIPAW